MWGNKRVKALEKENADLKSQIEIYRASLKTWEDRYDDNRLKARQALPSIDFKSLKAFSIERMIDQNGSPHTLIGYYKNDDKLGEWYIYCDDAGHASLVKQFNESLGLNNGH